MKKEFRVEFVDNLPGVAWVDDTSKERIRKELLGRAEQIWNRKGTAFFMKDSKNLWIDGTKLRRKKVFLVESVERLPHR